MNQEKKKTYPGMMALFMAIVFLSTLANSAITILVVYLLVQLDLLTIPANVVPAIGNLVLITAVVSIPVGILDALVICSMPLKPIRNLIDSMNRLASGDFKTRVSIGKIMRRYPAFVDIVGSFNKMAEQLENTELLRSDFVNNFSHEFKTPIVSIAGFAKLLNKGNLSQEQQREYLSVIEEESMRLSYMATNVLNLTKIENQTILTDISEFNLSEQIRSCILLLENKWMKKDLEFSLEFDEYNIRANEEMLKEIWINLLDNAVKFSSDGGLIRVNIHAWPDRYTVSVTNYGSEISRENQSKIWNKFFQVDESRASEGNGVGLAIVKRVAELHRGSVSVSSGSGVTTFSVTLPK